MGRTNPELRQGTLMILVLEALRDGTMQAATDPLTLHVGSPSGSGHSRAVERRRGITQ